MNKKIKFLILVAIFVVSCNEKENKTSEFLKNYDKVRLISYNKSRNLHVSENELKIENDTLIVPTIKIVDNIVLNKDFSEKIVDVLFSTKEFESGGCTFAECYNPRHIMLFYKKNKVIAFYEFCAECGGSRHSKNINFPILCSEKGDRIIEVFKEMKLENNGEETENYKYF